MGSGGIMAASGSSMMNEVDHFEADKQGFSVEVAGIRTRNFRAEDSDAEPDEGGDYEDQQDADSDDNELEATEKGEKG